MATFGDRLRLAMTHAKVSLDQLAEHMDVHPVTLSRWRQQDEMPRDRHRVALAAEKLNVDVEWLLTGRPVKGGKSFPVGFIGEHPSHPDAVRAALGESIVREAPAAELAAPAFVEHVLFTAGRIAELANQIAAAAAQQQRVSYELGQRAESEGRRPPSPVAVTPLPTGKAPKHRNRKA